MSESISNILKEGKRIIKKKKLNENRNKAMP